MEKPTVMGKKCEQEGKIPEYEGKKEREERIYICGVCRMFYLYDTTEEQKRKEISNKHKSHYNRLFPRTNSYNLLCLLPFAIN